MSNTPSRKALQLLPPYATTGIGSLPHTQLELALQMALQQDLPFLPQLPAQQPSELMIPAALEGLPGLAFDADGSCTVQFDTWLAGRDQLALSLELALPSNADGTFEPSPQSSRAWRPFLFEVEQRKLPFAKVQLAGPATVRWVTRTTDGRPAHSIPELDQQIFRLILARALAMTRAVRRTGATPIFFLDEPGLYALDAQNLQHALVLKELQMLTVALQREGTLVGVHCCSNTHWPRLLDLGFDIVSIDARLSLDALLEDRDAWLRFVGSGATLALGIIPTDLSSTYRVSELCDSVEASLRATTPSLPFEALLSRMLLTPACGLGLRTVLDAERIFAEVHEARRHFRSLSAQ